MSNFNLTKLGVLYYVDQLPKFLNDVKKAQKAINDSNKASATASGKTTKAQREEQQALQQWAALEKKLDAEVSASKANLAKVQEESSDKIIAALEKEKIAQRELADLQKTRAAQGARPRDITTGRYISQAQAQAEAGAALAASQRAQAEVTAAQQPVFRAQAAAQGAEVRRGNIATIGAAMAPVKPEDVKTMANMAGATKQYEQVLAEAEAGTAGLTTATKGLGAALASAAVSAAAIYVAFKALSIFKGIIDDTAQLGVETFQLQQVMGATAKDASSLIYVFRQFGVEPKTLTTAMGIFSRNLALVRENIAGLNTRGQQSTRVFAGLGVKIVDSNNKLRPTIDIMKDLADRLQALGTGGGQQGILTQLFGEQGGRAMLPIFLQGSAGIEKMQKDAEALGVTLDDKAAKSALKYAQAQKDMNAAMLGAKTQIGGALLPGLASIATGISNLIPMVEDALGPLISAIQDIFKTAGVGKFFLDFLIKPIEGGILLFAHAFNMIRDIVQAFAALLHGDFSKAGKLILDALKNLAQSVASMFLAILGPIPDLFASVLEKAVNFVIDAVNKLPKIKVPVLGININFGDIGHIRLPRLSELAGVDDFEKGVSKLGKSTKDTADAIQEGTGDLDGFTDAEKRAMEELQKLAQAFESTSKEAGNVENLVASLKLFGIVSAELAERQGLSAAAAGMVQGVDAVINAQKRGEAAAYNYATTLSTVAQAFSQNAKVAQTIVLGLARTALDATKQAISAVTGQPTREVADLGVQLAQARVSSARVAEQQNPRLRELQNQLKQFDTSDIDKQMRELNKKSDVVDKHFRDLKRAAEKQEKALDKQGDALDAQLNQMKRAEELAQIAFDRMNANLERQIAATQKQASDLQKAFLQSNENLQRQINAAIGRGDTAGALGLVDIQRRNADIYHAQARGLQNTEERLTAQQKAAKLAEEERQRQAKLAEDEVQARKDALDQAKKQLQAATDFTDAENAAKDALDDQKTALEDQKLAIEDNRKAVQDQIDAIQGVIDKSKIDEQTIQEHIDVYQAETGLLEARATAAQRQLQTQEEQRQSMDDLITKVGTSSQAIVDLASATGQSVYKEVNDLDTVFSTFSGALRSLVDDDFRGTLVEDGIDPTTEHMKILQLAIEDIPEAIRRLTTEQVMQNAPSGTGPRSVFDVWGHTSSSSSGSGNLATRIFGGNSPRGVFAIGRNAYGGIYNSPILSTLAENGPEAVVPLNNPFRAREIMAQIPPSLLASLLPRGRGAAVFAPQITVTGETLDTMEAVAHRALSNAFRDARITSTRSSGQLATGIGANI